MLKSKSRQHEGMGTDGNTEFFGVNIFDYAWHNTKEKALVCRQRSQQRSLGVLYQQILSAYKGVHNGTFRYPCIRRELR